MFRRAERYGLAWTCLHPGADTAIAPSEAWDDPDCQPILPPPVDSAACAGRKALSR